MIELLASHAGYAKVYREYLPALVMEYKFWVKKQNYLNNHPENEAYARVVRMPDGEMLGRYYDNRQTPRPEMAGDDVEAAAISKANNNAKLFLDLRAGAESGWDFSSRWLHDANNLSTICTTDVVPVDLNSLLYHLEKTIARAYRAGDQVVSANKFDSRARKRAEAISKYMWNEKQGFFFDYNFRIQEQTTSLTLAAAFPLYAGCASKDQAAAVAKVIEKEFLRPGGLTTTLVNSGQQWDEPNGWAPLQWVTIAGLEQYGFVELAAKIRDAWLKNIEAVFKKHRKMIEKYDVSRVGGLGGGGEYPLQDGFGWTNGVYAALKDRQVND
jgi:alpha,alpha-trehalase